MDFKPGDLVGFSGNSWTSGLICLGSLGVPWYSLSHVGIIAAYEDSLLLFESTTLNTQECVIKKRPIEGSQAHEIDKTVELYCGKVWHYPLFRSLFDHESKRLTDFLVKCLALPYDAIGAFRSGGQLFSWFESMLRDEDLHSLFCSELCAAAHANIGILASDSGSKWSPSKLTRHERRLGILKKPRRLK